jgi:hypothetical protein
VASVDLAEVMHRKAEAADAVVAVEARTAAVVEAADAVTAAN